MIGFYGDKLRIKPGSEPGSELGSELGSEPGSELGSEPGFTKQQTTKKLIICEITE